MPYLQLLAHLFKRLIKQRLDCPEAFSAFPVGLSGLFKNIQVADFQLFYLFSTPLRLNFMVILSIYSNFKTDIA